MESTKTIPTRTDRYKLAIKSMILSQLSKARVRELRKEYQSGNMSIVVLSQRTDVPPVLLWSLLTPLYEKTHIKHKMLRLETQIRVMWAKGISFATIAEKLRITKAEVIDYTTEQYSERVCKHRPWYAECPVVIDPVENKWHLALGGKLPPASRIGQKPGELSEIPADKLGRCPTCGKMVHMPCYACNLKEFLKGNAIPPAEDAREYDEDDEILPDLMFN